MINLILLVLTIIPLYPKFPLFGVTGTFVAVRLEDLILAAVYIIWGLWAVKNRAWKEFTPTHRAILLFWIIGAAATFSGIFLTKTTTLELGILHSLRRVEYMGLFFVAYSWVRSKEHLKSIINVIVVVSLFVAGYGIGQQLAGFPVISTNNSEFSKGLALTLGPGARINSTFAGHYDLAAYSLLPLTLLLALLFLPGTSKKEKLVLGGIWLVVYWVMLMSASRASFVAVFMSAGLLLLIIRRFRWIVVLAAIGIVGILVSPQLLGRYRELIINHLSYSVVTTVRAAVDEEVPDALKPPAVAEDRSLNIRLKASWPKAIRAVEKSPLLGTGYASVGLAIDNDYLRLAAEMGILGVLAFLLIIRNVFRQSWQYLRNFQLDLNHVFVAAVVCTLVGLLANAVFIDIFEASKVAIILWLALGVSAKVSKLS